MVVRQYRSKGVVMRLCGGLIFVLLFAIATACGDDDHAGSGTGGVGGLPVGGSGGAGGIAGGGSGGDLGPGGTGGGAGGEVIEGPLGFVELSWDFPDAYGEMTYHVGKTEFPSVDQIPDVCSGNSANVVAIPAGDRVIVARSKNGFVWRVDVDIVEAGCISVDLTADGSESRFDASGIGPGAERNLPAVFSVNGVESGVVSLPFIAAEFLDRSSTYPDSPKRVIMEFVSESRLFVLPLNADDPYPMKYSFVGADALSPLSGEIRFPELPPEETNVMVFDTPPSG